MEFFTASINGVKYTFSEYGIRANDQFYSFDKITNVRHAGGKNPKFVFDYDGREIQLPYEKKEKDALFKYFFRDNKAPRAKTSKKKGCLVAIIIMLALLLVGCIGVFILGEDEDVPEVSESEDTVATTEIKPVTFEEQTLYEGHDVVIKLTSSEQTSSGIDLNFYIENNSSKSLGFNAHAYGVNGIMTKNNIYDMDTDVAAGRKANATLTIDNSFLRDSGILEVKYMDILFWAYDNDEMFKDFDTGVIRIKSDLFNEKINRIKGSDLYDDSEIKVELLYLDGNSASFVLTNNTGSYIDFDVTDISFDGYTVSDLDTDLDLHGIKVFDDSQVWFTISMNSEFQEQNGLDSFSEVEFYINYRPNEDYFEEAKTGAIVARNE